eukprot:1424775-Amphidinium_carterae.2
MSACMSIVTCVQNVAYPKLLEGPSQMSMSASGELRRTVTLMLAHYQFIELVEVKTCFRLSCESIPNQLFQVLPCPSPETGEYTMPSPFV